MSDYELRIRGSNHGSGSATWGQSAMGLCVASVPTKPTAFNFGDIIALPPRSPSFVLHRLQTALRQFSCFRTSVWRDGNGFRQTIRPEVRSVVSVRDAHDQTEVQRLHQGNLDTTFGFESSLHWSFLIIRCRGHSYLSVSIDHLILDFLGWNIVKSAIGKSLANEEAGVAEEWDTLYQALEEGSQAGKRRSASALERHHQILDRSFKYSSPHPAASASSYVSAALTCPNLSQSVEHIANAAHSSTSTVLFSAFVQEWAGYVGAPEVVVKILASNRYGKRVKHLASTMAWDGLMLINVAAAGTGTQLMRSLAAAYLRASYDPIAGRLLESKLGVSSRGLVGGVHFNDGHASVIRLKRESCRELITMYDNRMSEFDAAIYFHVRDHFPPGQIRIDLVADATVVGSAELEAMLSRTHRRLCDEGGS